MSEAPIKPLNRSPVPRAGFTAERRPDGGMHIVFQNVDPDTLSTGASLPWRTWKTRTA